MKSILRRTSIVRVCVCKKLRKRFEYEYNYEYETSARRKSEATHERSRQTGVSATGLLAEATRRMQSACRSERRVQHVRQPWRSSRSHCSSNCTHRWQLVIALYCTSTKMQKQRCGMRGWPGRGGAVRALTHTHQRVLVLLLGEPACESVRRALAVQRVRSCRRTSNTSFQ